MADKKTSREDKMFRCGACKAVVSEEEAHKLTVNATYRPVNNQNNMFKLTTELLICNACFQLHGKRK